MHKYVYIVGEIFLDRIIYYITDRKTNKYLNEQL